MEEINFKYIQHGLLFIVYVQYDGDMWNKEDSKWDNEADAKKHCEILNNEIAKRRTCKHNKVHVTVKKFFEYNKKNEKLYWPNQTEAKCLECDHNLNMPILDIPLRTFSKEVIEQNITRV